MPDATISTFVKRRKVLVVFSLLIVAYLGAGVAFREYRMDPKNEYHSRYLPSAGTSDFIASSPEEAMEKLTRNMFREPSLMERIFTPAESIFRFIGY